MAGLIYRRNINVSNVSDGVGVCKASGGSIDRRTGVAVGVPGGNNARLAEFDPTAAMLIFRSSVALLSQAVIGASPDFCGWIRVLTGIGDGFLPKFPNPDAD